MRWEHAHFRPPESGRHEPEKDDDDENEKDRNDTSAASARRVASAITQHAVAGRSTAEKSELRAAAQEQPGAQPWWKRLGEKAAQVPRPETEQKEEPEAVEVPAEAAQARVEDLGTLEKFAKKRQGEVVAEMTETEADTPEAEAAEADQIYLETVEEHAQDARERVADQVPDGTPAAAEIIDISEHEIAELYSRQPESSEDAVPAGTEAVQAAAGAAAPEAAANYDESAPEAADLEDGEQPPYEIESLPALHEGGIVPPGEQGGHGQTAEDDGDGMYAGYARANAPGGRFGGIVPPPGGAAQSYGYNQQPSTPNVVTAPAAETDGRAERAGSGALVVLGLVASYLFGRHRGRVTTERRMERQFKPIQEKLAERVEALQSKVMAAEGRIRNLVYRQEAQQYETRARTSGTVSYAAEARRTYTGERPAAASAGRPEMPRPAGRPEVRSAEAVKHMNREEVREAARDVKVGATDLEAVMAVGLVTEAGGRHVLETFLRGGDFRRVLQEEMRNAEAEESPERDPRLRHHRQDAESQPAGAAGARAEAGVTAIDPATGIPIVVYDNTPVGAPGLAGSPQHSPRFPAQVAKSETQPTRAHSALITANVIAFVVLSILLIILLFVYL